MVNNVTSPAEYWYALTFIAEKLGYKSRQDLVAFVIKSVVEQHPEELERGIEKAGIMEAARVKVKQMEDKGFTLKNFEIPNLKPSENKRYQLVMENGESVVIFAPSLLEAGQKYFKNPEMTMDEFWDSVKSGKEVDVTYTERQKTWNG